MAEARALKLCTKGVCIKSGQSDDKSLLKGAWFCSRELEKLSTPLVSCDTQCRRQRTTVYGTYGASHLTNS